MSSTVTNFFHRFAGTLGQETSSRIGIALSSDLLVLGSYASLGKPGHRQLRLDVRLQDARTGNIVTEVAETGGEDDLFRLTSRVGNKLRQKLGIAGATEAEQAKAMTSLPSKPEAARLYVLGLNELRQFDALPAKDLFEQAIKVDPKFPFSHLMLARAWGQLGYEQGRRAEAKKALDLSANLPSADRMLVEGDYYQSLANHEKAASTYRALFALFPDSLEYGLQLAIAQTSAGQPSRARETISQLRQLPPPASNDPRIDLVESLVVANANKALGLMLIRSALSKAASQSKKLVYAHARKLECMNLIYGDHPDQGAASCEDAYKIFLAAGNRLDAADCVRLIADGQGAGGHYAQAIATYQRALRILQELPPTGKFVSGSPLSTWKAIVLALLDCPENCK
jgi:tetratricopeptide (TPR) repeat protein